MVTAGDIIRASRKKAGIAQTQTPESVARIAREEPKKARRSWTSAGALAKAEIAARPTPTPTRTPLPAGTTAEDTLAGIDAAAPSGTSFKDRLIDTITQFTSPEAGRGADPLGRGQTILEGIKSLSTEEFAAILPLPTGIGSVGKFGTSKAGAVGLLPKLGKTVINPKTTKKTIEWITKIALQLKKPKLVAGVIASGIVTAIGSYPFAGFIREESLQAIKGSYTGAMIQKNPEVAQLSLDERNQILSPDVTERILNGIPIVNVVKQLKDYFDVARTAAVLDQRLIDDMVIQQTTGETEDAKWERVRTEQAQQETDLIDYFNQQRILTEQEVLRLKEEAKKPTTSGVSQVNTLSQIDYWEDYAAEQRILEAEDRKAIAEFWFEYRKATLKMQDESRPSSLNFGLI